MEAVPELRSNEQVLTSNARFLNSRTSGIFVCRARKNRKEESERHPSRHDFSFYWKKEPSYALLYAQAESTCLKPAFKASETPAKASSLFSFQVLQGQGEVENGQAAAGPATACRHDSPISNLWDLSTGCQGVVGGGGRSTKSSRRLHLGGGLLSEGRSCCVPVYL